MTRACGRDSWFGDRSHFPAFLSFLFFFLLAGELYMCQIRVIVINGKCGRSIARSVVGLLLNNMQMRYARDLLLNCSSSLIKTSCCKEESATENENIENRKVYEPHNFSLDANFIWILKKFKLLK